jgi:hypothetical protein
MNKEYINGFVKRAQEAGIDEATALSLLKKVANHPGADPNAAGLQAGGMAPPPEQVVPQGAAEGGLPAEGGIPPELEQLINQLPPEVLAQIVQEIEQQLQGGGDGGAGAGPGAGAGGPPPGAGGMAGPPPGMGAGGPPPGHPHHKQGSEIIAKQASYIEGFVGRAYELGFDRATTQNIYKYALDLMSASSQPASAPRQEPQVKSAHFEGFLEKAASHGLSVDQAKDLYVRTFGNK